MISTNIVLWFFIIYYTMSFYTLYTSLFYSIYMYVVVFLSSTSIFSIYTSFTRNIQYLNIHQNQHTSSILTYYYVKAYFQYFSRIAERTTATIHELHENRMSFYQVIPQFDTSVKTHSLSMYTRNMCHFHLTAASTFPRRVPWR